MFEKAIKVLWSTKFGRQSIGRQLGTFERMPVLAVVSGLEVLR